MQTQQSFPNVTIGLDLGDQVSRTCEIDASGAIVKRAAVATTPGGMERYFSGRAPCRVVIEVGTHSPWVSRQLAALGHAAVVAHTAEVYGRGRRKRRNDAMDAEFLARQGRADVKLLHPIAHRSAEAQQDLELLKARDQLVEVRTKLISHVRGAVKPLGARIKTCSAESFARQAVGQIPQELRVALVPVVETIAELTGRIAAMERLVERVAKAHPACAQLRHITGVGLFTSVAYVRAVEEPRRFERSRDVGAYFGLVPRLDESGESSPQLRITKAGDALVRKYLVSAARYILGPFGPDCDLRRYGEAIAARGGKNARSRAAIAVARKLAVLLHHLWVSGASYDPNWSQRSRAA